MTEKNQAWGLIQGYFCVKNKDLLFVLGPAVLMFPSPPFPDQVEVRNSGEQLKKAIGDLLRFHQGKNNTRLEVREVPFKLWAIGYALSAYFHNM
jgi:hypothetical protein